MKTQLAKGASSTGRGSGRGPNPRLLFVVVSALTGCAAIIGVPDLSFDPDSAQGNPDGAADGTTGNDGGPASNDGGNKTDATTPCDESTLQTNSLHCGRCGHDCLGGACKEGKCEPVVVQGGLTNPTSLAVDAEFVYVTSRGDDTVRRIPKFGGEPALLVDNQDSVHGVQVSGDDLYWSNMDFAGDGGGDYWGGVWHCKLPACTARDLVTEGNWASNVQLVNGTLYFAENNGFTIVKVQPNGSGRTVLADPTKPLFLAVDSQHVYYSTNNSTMRRVPIDGGANEVVGPIEYGAEFGYVAVDDQNAYWTYTSSDPPYNGFVYGQPKANLSAPKIVYGTDNKGTIGLAIDATSIYWTTGSVTDIGVDFTRVGTLVTCPKTGCTDPTVIATGLLAPNAIAIDGDAIYFLEFGTSLYTSNGALKRVAKP